MHLIAVGETATKSHGVPSSKDTDRVLPSVKLSGKPVPEIVRMVPPKGFRSVEGVTEVTEKGMVRDETKGSIGMIP